MLQRNARLKLTSLGSLSNAPRHMRMAPRDTNSAASPVDLEDLARLHDTRASRIRSVLLRDGCDREDFEDIRQESFIAAMAGFSEYRGDAKGVTAWLGSIIRNRYLNFVRDKSTRRRHESIASREWERRLRSIHRRNPRQTSMIEQMSRALSLLRSPDQRLMWSHYVDGMTTQEIASLEGLEVRAIQKRIERARQRLRDIFTRLESSDTIA